MEFIPQHRAEPGVRMNRTITEAELLTELRAVITVTYRRIRRAPGESGASVCQAQASHQLLPDTADAPWLCTPSSCSENH